MASIAILIILIQPEGTDEVKSVHFHIESRWSEMIRVENWENAQSWEEFRRGKEWEELRSAYSYSPRPTCPALPKSITILCCGKLPRAVPRLQSLLVALGSDKMGDLLSKMIDHILSVPWSSISGGIAIPLNKIRVPQLGWWFPTEWEKKIMFQTTNQTINHYKSTMNSTLYHYWSL